MKSKLINVVEATCQDGTKEIASIRVDIEDDSGQVYDCYYYPGPDTIFVCINGKAQSSLILSNKFIGVCKLYAEALSGSEQK